MNENRLPPLNIEEMFARATESAGLGADFMEQVETHLPQETKNILEMISVIMTINKVNSHIDGPRDLDSLLVNLQIDANNAFKAMLKVANISPQEKEILDMFFSFQMSRA